MTLQPTLSSFHKELLRHPLGLTITSLEIMPSTLEIIALRDTRELSAVRSLSEFHVVLRVES